MCCIDKIVEVMRKLFFAVMSLLTVVAGCSESNYVELTGLDEKDERGTVSLKLKFDEPVGKALDDYDFVLDSEVIVNDIQVLVFDGLTGSLESSLPLAGVNDQCDFNLPVGEKQVYALINGPDVSRVRNLDDFFALTYDLSPGEQDGFAMIGSVTCEVKPGIVEECVVRVSRMASRVVLRSIKCNVARQYGGMTVDCVFLGNAAVQQNLKGDSFTLVNVDGYADASKSQPIGLDGECGACADYLYRSMGCGLTLGQRYEQPVCLYCQPNSSDCFTCLYLLVTIGDHKYYYRVSLDKGLTANTTCAVDVVITNLGAPLPPDGDMQKGEIETLISIDDWSLGNLYNAEF